MDDEEQNYFSFIEGFDHSQEVSDLLKDAELYIRSIEDSQEVSVLSDDENPNYFSSIEDLDVFQEVSGVTEVEMPTVFADTNFQESTANSSLKSDVEESSNTLNTSNSSLNANLKQNQSHSPMNRSNFCYMDYMGNFQIYGNTNSSLALNFNSVDFINDPENKASENQANILKVPQVVPPPSNYQINKIFPYDITVPDQIFEEETSLLDSQATTSTDVSEDHNLVNEEQQQVVVDKEHCQPSGIESTMRKFSNNVSKNKIEDIFNEDDHKNKQEALSVVETEKLLSNLHLNPAILPGKECQFSWPNSGTKRSKTVGEEDEEMEKHLSPTQSESTLPRHGYKLRPRRKKSYKAKYMSDDEKHEENNSDEDKNKNFVTETLADFYKKNPYPNEQEKRGLAKQTGLSDNHIGKWFKNRRHKDKISLKVEDAEVNILEYRRKQMDQIRLKVDVDESLLQYRKKRNEMLQEIDDTVEVNSLEYHKRRLQVFQKLNNP